MDKNIVCLQIHNDYQIVGGETKTAQKIADLLEANGIKVIRYYKSNKTFEDAGALRRIAVGIRSLYNSGTVKEIKEILADNKVDFALIHNTNPIISNSIYKILEVKKIPIIKYLQNYNLLCLNGALDHGEMCKKCYRNSLVGVRCACYKKSRIYSFVKYLIKRDLDKQYLASINAYMANSEFVKNKHVQLGIAPSKIHVMYNYIEEEGFTEKIDHQGYLYFGRLSREKGIITTIKAFEKMPDIELRILGSGELEKDIVTYLADHAIQNIHYLGQKKGKELAWEIYRAKCVIVPSEWDEPLPRTILEAYCQGTPVIGTDRGGIPEMIMDGKTGYIYAGGSVEELSRIIKDTEKLPIEKYRDLRMNCKQKLMESYTKEEYYKRFEQCIKSM